MPLVPPWIRIVSPAFSLPRWNTLVHTVKNVSGMPAAWIAREALRDRQALLVRHGGALGVAAAGQQRADRIADRPAAHVRAERGDDAGDFETGNIGRARRRRILAEALQHVGAIDARGGDVDQDFAGGGNRIGTLDELQDLRRTGLGDFYSS